MASRAVTLPTDLQVEAERLAESQGVSLDEFIVWAIAEKVSGLRRRLLDERFPDIEYRMGAAGWPTPVIRETGIRVQTLALEHFKWKLSAADIASEHDLRVETVEQTIAFYQSHKREIDASIEAEEALAEAEIT